MPTTYNLAPIPKWTLFDLTGKLLVGGKMYTYRANAKSIPKPVFQDAGGFFAYTNPIIFNGVGEAGPFYWASDENYYIEIYDAQNRLQWTVDNYNAPGGGGSSPVTNTFDYHNFILNGQFTFNYLTTYGTQLTNTDLAGAVTNPITIAEGNWQFQKSNSSATDTITFNLFNLGQTDVESDPKYWVNYTSTSPGAGGETFKDFIFYIEDVRTLANQAASLSFFGRSSSSSTVQVLIEQNFGSGSGASSPVFTTVGNYNLTSTWTKQMTAGFTIPNIGGNTIVGQDLFRVRIRMPLNVTCSVDITNIQLEIGNIVSTYQYLSNADVHIDVIANDIPLVQEGDEGSTLVVQPDLSIAWQTFFPPGVVLPYGGTTVPATWLACDGSSYLISDQQNLFNAIGFNWGVGDNSFIFANNTQYTNPASPANLVLYNAQLTPVADPSAGTSGFTVTKLISTNITGVNAFANGATIKINDTTRGNFLNSPSAGTTSFTVSTGAEHAVSFSDQYVTVTESAASLAGKYFEFSSNTTNFYVWYTVNGSGSDPGVSGRTGIQVNLLSTDDTLGVAYKTADAIQGNQATLVEFAAASAPLAGTYWQIASGTENYYIWYTVDGSGTDPAVPGATGIQVDVLSTDPATTVASKTQTAIQNAGEFLVPDLRGTFLRGVNGSQNGFDPDATYRYNAANKESGDQVGTYQTDEIVNHDHGINVGNLDTPAEGGVYGDGEKASIFPTTATGGSETRPINASVLYIIKT